MITVATYQRAERQPSGAGECSRVVVDVDGVVISIQQGTIGQPKVANIRIDPRGSDGLSRLDVKEVAATDAQVRVVVTTSEVPW